MCAERIPQLTRRPAEGGGFGEALRRAREARGMTLEAVARSTRIAAHHLDALERSDLDALPRGPFGRSYIRSYAEALGIDPGPILDVHHAQEIRRGLGTPERDQRMLQQLSHLVGRGEHGGDRVARLRSRPIAAAAVILLIVGATAWLLARNGTHGSPEKARPAAATTPPQPTPVPPPAPRARSRPDRLAASRPTPSPGARVAPPSPQVAKPPAAPSSPGAGQPTKPPASKLRTDSLRVSEFGVGADVVDHRLVGRADRFPAGSRVFFWTLVVGGQPGQVVRHVWFQGGRAVMRTDLPIGGPHWRTRSTHVLPDGSAGPWTVEARTSDGRLLARNDFACERRRSR